VSAAEAVGEGIPPGPARDVRQIVLAAIQRAPAECLLLSGGLDTSVLAPFAAARGTRAAITVLTAPDAPDREPARSIARGLGLVHHEIDTTLDALLEELDFVVATLETFDPMEIRNSLVIARALREAARQGYRQTMTGDAADELFGGYSFMMSKPEDEFERQTREMARTMHFSSAPMGRALGVDVRQPFCDPDVIACAVDLPKSTKVRLRDGVWVGKYVLREAFPEAASRWRRKDPIEVGSGATRYTAWFHERIPPEVVRDEAARILQEDRIEIRNAEHLAYYRAFRRIHSGRLSMRAFDPSTGCAHCGFTLPTPTSTFCVTCGAYPAR
jgi:asparagine synthase (glutamine-hydrolysing)